MTGFRLLTWPFWTHRPDPKSLQASIRTPAGVGQLKCPDLTVQPAPDPLCFEITRPIRPPDWVRGVRVAPRP